MAVDVSQILERIKQLKPVENGSKESFEIHFYSPSVLQSSDQVRQMVFNIYRIEMEVKISAGFCDNPFHVRFDINDIQ